MTKPLGEANWPSFVNMGNQMLLILVSLIGGGTIIQNLFLGRSAKIPLPQLGGEGLGEGAYNFALTETSRQVIIAGLE